MSSNTKEFLNSLGLVVLLFMLSCNEFLCGDDKLF